jgi:hypothetical protein
MFSVFQTTLEKLLTNPTIIGSAEKRFVISMKPTN